MRYFILANNEQNAMPRIMNWYTTVKPRFLYEMKRNELPRFFQLEMKLENDYVYTDIITNPFFLVSKEAAKIMHMYDKSIQYIGTILHDKKRKINFTYFLPLLKKVTSLEDGRDKVIFIWSKGIELHVVPRMDLIESMLERDAIGIKLIIIEKEGKNL